MSAKSVLLNAQQEVARLKGEQASIRQEMSDVTARMHAIPYEIAQTRASEAIAAAQIDQTRVETTIQSADTVVSSVDGKVLAIPVDSGQALNPGATVAIIEPANARLEVELFVPSRAMGFIRRGDEVRVMYQAFPFEKFGSAKARVTEISQTILTPSEVAMPGSTIAQPVFRVRAGIEKQTVQAYGQTIQLQPGMLLNAQIVFDRRSLVEWLFDPIYAALEMNVGIRPLWTFWGEEKCGDHCLRGSGRVRSRMLGDDSALSWLRCRFEHAAPTFFNVPHGYVAPFADDGWPISWVYRPVR